MGLKWAPPLEHLVDLGPKMQFVKRNLTVKADGAERLDFPRIWECRKAFIRSPLWEWI